MKLWLQYRDHITGVGALTLGSAAGVLVPALLTPMLMTLYTAEQFGSFGFAASILAVISQIICLKYDTPLSLGSNDSTALYYLCVLASVAVSLLVLVCSMVARLLGGIGGLEAMLLAAGSFFMGINLSLTSLAISHKRYLTAGVAAALRGTSAAVIPLFMYQSTSQGLLWGYGASYLTSSVFYFVALQKVLIPVSLPSLTQLKSTAVKHLDYLKFSSVGGLSVSLISAVTNYFLISAAGQGALGAYTVVNRLLVAPVLLFGGCVGQVYGRAAGEVYPDVDATYKLTKKYRTALSLIAVSVCIVGGSGLALVSVLLDGEWVQLMGFLPPVLLLLAVRLVVVPLTTLLLVAGRQLRAMCWQVVMLVIWGFIGGICVLIGSSPVKILWAHSIVLCLCYLWGYLEVMRVLKEH